MGLSCGTTKGSGMCDQDLNEGETVTLKQLLPTGFLVLHQFLH